MWLLFVLVTPILYNIIAYALEMVTVDCKESTVADKTIHPSTNGIHLDIVLPRDNAFWV